MNAKLNYLATLITWSLIKAEARKRIAELEGKLLVALREIGINRVTYKLDDPDQAYAVRDTIRLSRAAQSDPCKRIAHLCRCAVWSLRTPARNLPVLSIPIADEAITLIDERGWAEKSPNYLEDLQAISCELGNEKSLAGLERQLAIFTLQ